MPKVFICQPRTGKRDFIVPLISWWRQGVRSVGRVSVGVGVPKRRPDKVEGYNPKEMHGRPVATECPPSGLWISPAGQCLGRNERKSPAAWKWHAWGPTSELKLAASSRCPVPTLSGHVPPAAKALETPDVRMEISLLFLCSGRA